MSISVTIAPLAYSRRVKPLVLTIVWFHCVRCHCFVTLLDGRSFGSQIIPLKADGTYSVYNNYGKNDNSNPAFLTAQGMSLQSMLAPC